MQQRTLEAVGRALGRLLRSPRRACAGAARFRARGTTRRRAARVEPGPRRLAVDRTVGIGPAVERAADDGVGDGSSGVAHGRAATGSSPRMPRAHASPSMRRLPAGWSSTSSSAPSAQPSSRRRSSTVACPARATEPERGARGPDRDCLAADGEPRPGRRREGANPGVLGRHGPADRARGRRVPAWPRRTARRSGGRSRARPAAAARARRRARRAELQRPAVGLDRGLLRSQRERLAGRDRPGVERLDEQDDAARELVLACQIARSIGAAPRQRGSLDGCRFSQGSASSSERGTSSP